MSTSTSALSKESLAYTYTTVPSFTNTMVGFSASNNTLLVTTITTTNAFDALSITIDNPGVYLCEGTIEYQATPIYNVVCSLSTTSATLNNTNKASARTSGTISINTNVPVTTIITIAAANTTLYCVGQCQNSSPTLTISSGFIKYTRIA